MLRGTPLYKPVNNSKKSCPVPVQHTEGFPGFEHRITLIQNFLLIAIKVELIEAKNVIKTSSFIL